MDTPRILLSGSREGWANYDRALRHAGGAPSGGYCPTVDLSCDGLLLCGGDDMDPKRFGQDNDGSQGIDPDRDAAEFALAEAFLAAGKPIFGICRGHQVLNVVLGGDLVQDLGPELCAFHQRDPEGGDKVHAVRAEPASLLGRFYGPVFAVNSSHHQAVGRLGDGLRAAARSESGVIEALEHDTRPVFSVQFHPERMAYAMRRPDTVDGSFLFAHFIALCRGV